MKIVIDAHIPYLNGVIDAYADVEYVPAEKIDNASIGTYFIGTESIHTITADQKKNVEGSIPFSFKDGNLALHGATGDLKKNIK